MDAFFAFIMIYYYSELHLFGMLFDCQLKHLIINMLSIKTGKETDNYFRCNVEITYLMLFFMCLEYL